MERPRPLREGGKEMTNDRRSMLTDTQKERLMRWVRSERAFHPHGSGDPLVSAQLQAIEIAIESEERLRAAREVVGLLRATFESGDLDPEEPAFKGLHMALARYEEAVKR